MEKDKTIIELLKWLREQLGEAFIITDHWDADLCAIGVSAPNDVTQLAYISSYRRPNGYYFLELETSAAPGADEVYREAAKFESVNRDELLHIVAKHLRIRK